MAVQTCDAAPSDGGGKPLLPFFMVFGGCMSAVVAMEYVLAGDPSAGNLLTLSEFAFVFVQSVPGRVDANFRPRPLLAPWWAHAQHALLWVSMSVLVNYVFGFNISVPIHTLFRSCNVIATCLLGTMVFGQRYSVKQLICVCVISVGIFMGSIGDSQKFRCKDCEHGGSSLQADGSSKDGMTMWMTGIAMLVLVQVLQGFLGHVQGGLYKQFQKLGTREELADEFLFTSHVAAFAPMLLLRTDIATAWQAALATPLVASWCPVPTRLMWMLLNNLLQLICIRGVFRLAAYYAPLTVTITLTVRKFSSTCFSILWFGNHWTLLHSGGAIAIFGGVFAYSQCRPLGDPAKKNQ